MRKYHLYLEMEFDRTKDADLYADYSALSLLFGSIQKNNLIETKSILDELESAMDKGKKYHIVIEEVN